MKRLAEREGEEHLTKNFSCQKISKFFKIFHPDNTKSKDFIQCEKITKHFVQCIGLLL